MTRSRTRPKVLMTLADVAWPLNGGKRLRVESLLRHVARTCDVDAVTLFADPDPQRRPLPPDVDVRRWISLPRDERPPLRTAAGLLARRVPWQVAVHDWRAAEAALADWPKDHDVVWFGSMDHAVSLAGLARGTRTVVDCDDVESAKLQRFLDLPRSDGLPVRDRVQRRVEVPLWARVQRRVLRTSDSALVCSELDRGRLAAFGPAERIDVVPNTYPAPAAVPDRRPPATCTLLMVANYGTDQNLDAAAYAARQVLPELRRRVPEMRLRLVGREIDRIAGLEGTDGLDLVGPVDEVGDELAGATAVLVPIRYGGGTRLKILEAFAHGVPVVSTRGGAEGLGVVDGEHLLLADTPEDIADAVCRLVDEPGLADRLTHGGRALWQSRYTPAAAQDAVEQVLDRLLDTPR